MKHPESFQRLNVLCGENKDILVNIDYISYHSTFTFKRDCDLWYLCHTWTRTWGEGSNSSTVFINLNTGQRYDTDSLSFWRGSLQISTDGKLALVSGGIFASSAVFTAVIDLSNLPKLEYIYFEQYGDSAESKFLPDNSIYFEYGFARENEFFEVYLNSDYSYYDKEYSDDDDYDEDFKWKVTVVRKFDPNRKFQGTAKLPYSSYGAPYEDVKKMWTRFGVAITINHMIDISETFERANGYEKTLCSEALCGAYVLAKKLMEDPSFDNESRRKILDSFKTLYTLETCEEFEEKTFADSSQIRNYQRVLSAKLKLRDKLKK